MWVVLKYWHNSLFIYMAKIYFLTGCAGFGKSTLAKKLILKGAADVHYEADMWMVNMETGSYEFDPRKLKYCHSRCFDSTVQAMIRGWNIVVANTFLRKWEIKSYISEAKHYGYDIEIIHLEDKGFKSIHNVPDSKIEEMKKKREFFTLEDFNN